MHRKPPQQLTQITTVPTATSYIFPIDDAKGFPHVLPPARKIGLTRRSLTGVFAMAEKTLEGPRFESSLERDFFVLLEFDLTVSAWSPQPVRLPSHPNDSLPRKYYTPDVLVEYFQTQGDADFPFLYEVKYREQIRKDWEKLKWKFRACVHFAKENGLRFKVMTEKEIRTPRLFNAKFLLPYRARKLIPEDCERLRSAMKEKRTSTPEELLQKVARTTNDRLHLIPSLWRLLVDRELAWNEEEKITMNTVIQTKDSNE